MATSLKEILITHGLNEKDLGEICSNEHRDELTKTITDWKAVGAALGFTQEELDIIDSGFPSEEQKKTALLFQWSMRDKKEATYFRLAEYLFAGRLLYLLDELCRIINFYKATLIVPTGQFHKLSLIFAVVLIFNIQYNRYDLFIACTHTPDPL